MITEKRLVISHTWFWERTLPMGAACVRHINISTERFAEPMHSDRVQARGIINEAAYRIFCMAAGKGRLVSSLGEEDVLRGVEDAVLFIQRFRQFSRQPVSDPDSDSIREAVALAERIELFVAEERAPLVLAPRFSGCGWVDECNGDLLQRECLYEIKAGDSGFKSQDLRQLLVYCALNFASRAYQINQVCLVNPRRGVYWMEDVGVVCLAAAGASPSNVYGDIIQYISEPQWRDETV